MAKISLLLRTGKRIDGAETFHRSAEDNSSHLDFCRLTVRASGGAALRACINHDIDHGLPTLALSGVSQAPSRALAGVLEGRLTHSQI